MRNRVEIIALVLVIAFIVGMLSLSRQEDFDSPVPTRKRAIRSTFRSTPDGYKVLYLTLDSMGYRVQRLTRTYPFLPERGMLVVADPYRKPFTRLERRTLLEWVGRGNSALILLDQHTARFARAFSEPKEGEEPEIEVPQWAEDIEDMLGTPAATTREDAASRVAPFAEAAPALAVDSSGSIILEQPISSEVADALEGATVPLYTSTTGAKATFSRVGRGYIIFCASPWSLSNQALKEHPENLQFALTVANLQPGTPIIFDEYHHGFGTNMSLWSLAPPLTKLGIAQVLTALLLLFAVVGWRFGRERRPVDERFTRSRAEYLTSMAALLERAEATHVVRDRVSLLLRRELGKRLGLRPSAPPERFLEANGRSGAVDQALLERVLRQLQGMERMQRPDPNAMLRVTAEVHRLLSRK